MLRDVVLSRVHFSCVTTQAKKPSYFILSVNPKWPRSLFLSRFHTLCPTVNPLSFPPFTLSALPSRVSTSLEACQECRCGHSPVYNNLRGLNIALIERNDVISILVPLNLWHRWSILQSPWHLKWWMVCIWVSACDIGERFLPGPSCVRLFFFPCVAKLRPLLLWELKYSRPAKFEK